MSTIQERNERDFEADDDTSWQRTVDGTVDNGTQQPVGTNDEMVCVIFESNDPDRFIASDTFVTFVGQTEVSRPNINAGCE